MGVAGALAAIIMSPAGISGAGDCRTSGMGVAVDCAETRVCGSTEAWRTASSAGATAAATSEKASSLTGKETFFVASSRCPVKKTVESRDRNARARMKR
jgi:hypothetical protein